MPRLFEVELGAIDKELIVACVGRYRVDVHNGVSLFAELFDKKIDVYHERQSTAGSAGSPSADWGGQQTPKGRQPQPGCVCWQPDGYPSPRTSVQKSSRVRARRDRIT